MVIDEVAMRHGKHFLLVEHSQLLRQYYIVRNDVIDIVCTHRATEA